MAVKLRLTRFGSKHRPFYRIVAMDSRTKRDGKYIDLLGTYNPLTSEVTLNKELSLKWLTEGAKPSDTVRNIFSKQGIMTEFHNQKMKSKPKKKKVSKAKSVKKITTKKAKVAPKKTATSKKASVKTATKKPNTKSSKK